MNTIEYVCIPEKKTKSAMIACGILFLAAALLFVCSMLLPSFRLVGQILSVCILLALIQITNKFILATQKYTWKGGQLIFSTVTGKKERVLGGISVTSDCYLYSKKKWERRKEDHHITRRFSYLQNLSSRGEYVLLLPERRDFVMVRFEPDEKLASLIQEKIDEIQN